MSLVAPVKNGQVIDTRAAEEEQKKSEKSGGNLDKDAFLQLLVAQMKYQDPLEPTSNTEYISQLATFSSLEEMQNMTSAMNLQRASNLVGQEVYIKVTDPTTGNVGYEHGKVNFVSYQNGKAYVNVNGEDYPLDNVQSIYDPEYSVAYDMAYEWTVGLNRLPNLSKVTLSDKDDIMKLKDTFDKMTDYQKSFLTEENKKKLESYVNQIELLIKAKEELDDKLNGADKEDEDDKVEGADGDKTEDTDKTEGDGSDKTEGTDKTEGSGSDKTEGADKTEGSGSNKTEGTEKTEETGKNGESVTEQAAGTSQAENAAQAGMTAETDTPTEAGEENAGIAEEP